MPDTDTTQPAVKGEKKEPNRAFLNKVLRIRRTGEAAVQHAADLPNGQARGDELIAMADELEALNKRQEELERERQKVTEQLKERLKAAEEARARTISAAEGEFGKKDARIKDFKAKD